MFKLEDFENGMVVELEDGKKRLYWEGNFIDQHGYIPIKYYNANLNNTDRIGNRDDIKRIFTSTNISYFGAFLIEDNLTEIWNRYNRPKEKINKYNELIDEIEGVMMSISVRKTEYSKIAHDEKMNKPSFHDLDWCFEQLYYLKQKYGK